MTRLSRHTLLLVVSNLGGAGLSFLLSVMIGRTLGDTGLGQYAVVMAWIFPLSLLVEFGLGTLALREIGSDTRLTAPYMQALARARLILGGAVTLWLILCAPLLSDQPAIITGLIVSAPMVIIQPFYGVFTSVFKVQGAMWPVPWLNIGMLMTQVILTALVLAIGGGVTAALIVNILTSAVQLAAAYALYRTRFRPSGNASPAPPLIPLLRRAWPFALAALFAAVQTRLSLILLEQFASSAEVGVYAAASRFVEAGRLLPNAFFGALFPLLIAQPQIMEQTFRRSILMLGGFGLAASLITVFIAPWLVALTYGETFAAASPVLQMLIWSLLFGGLRGARTLYWYARGQEQRVNLINAVVIGVQIALSLWLIPPLGAVGVAVTMVLVEAAALGLLWLDLPLLNYRVLKTKLDT
jgi:O-antigen/teichoic acid export membrane protein